jgi:hypothetical protein
VARYEHHGSHPGKHVHAHCDRGGVEAGASGMSGLVRIPPAGARHRRTGAFTVSTFWSDTCRFFSLEEDFGPLFST